MSNSPFRFGVCCVFIINDGDDVYENCTYIQNSAYPSGDTSATSVSYKVQKCNDGENEETGRGQAET